MPRTPYKERAATKAEAQAAMDKETAEKLLEVARKLPIEDLWRFCEGTLRASALAQQVMVERFGLEEWQRFNLAVETGRIKIP